MFVSTRRRFRAGDSGWNEYVESVGLPALSEVRSIDASLNGYAEDFGDIKCTGETIDEEVAALPAPQSSAEYFLLAVNLDKDPPVQPAARWALLGYDLSDETETSSLLNCGRWEADLAPFAQRLNEVGLLSLEDARAAQRALPEAWGDCEPHALADVWAVYARNDSQP